MFIVANFGLSNSPVLYGREIIDNKSESLGDSRVIVTNQPGIHEKLEEIVEKHLTHRSQKPYQAHTQQAFAEIDKIVQAFAGDIILDSCCGVGQSTRLLAKKIPMHWSLV